MSTITFTLGLDDPKAPAFLAALTAVMGGTAAPVVAMTGNKAVTAAKPAAGVAATVAPTLESLRAQVTGAKDKREQMKAALAKYGATSVSTLAVENYEAFQADINEILK